MSTGPNTHPADELIRRFIEVADLQPSHADIEMIVERMATAPFNNQMQRAPRRLRGHLRGRLLEGRADALSLHLIKRVYEDEQWTRETTADEFLQDVRSAIRAKHARLVVFRNWGGSFAATIVETESIVPSYRRGSRTERLLFSLYSADSAIIVTAYMISSLAALRLSGDARWLT